MIILNEKRLDSLLSRLTSLDPEDRRAESSSLLDARPPSQQIEEPRAPESESSGPVGIAEGDDSRRRPPVLNPTGNSLLNQEVEPPGPHLPHWRPQIQQNQEEPTRRNITLNGIQQRAYSNMQDSQGSQTNFEIAAVETRRMKEQRNRSSPKQEADEQDQADFSQRRAREPTPSQLFNGESDTFSVRSFVSGSSLKTGYGGHNSQPHFEHPLTTADNAHHEARLTIAENITSLSRTVNNLAEGMSRSFAVVNTMAEDLQESLRRVNHRVTVISETQKRTLRKSDTDERTNINHLMHAPRGEMYSTANNSDYCVAPEYNRTQPDYHDYDSRYGNTARHVETSMFPTTTAPATDQLYARRGSDISRRVGANAKPQTNHDFFSDAPDQRELYSEARRAPSREVHFDHHHNLATYQNRPAELRLRKKEEFPPIDLDNMELSLTLFEETAERYGISSEKLLYSHALIVIGYDITHRFQAQRPGPKTYQKLKEFLLDRYQPEIPCHKKSHPKTTFVQALTNAEDRILGSSQDELLKAAIIDKCAPRHTK